MYAVPQKEMVVAADDITRVEEELMIHERSCAT